MDKGCFNCGSTDEVRWRENKKEFYCELCIETELADLERCPECKCVLGDLEYKDFSNKNIVVCPQCKHEIYLEECSQ